MEGDGGSDVEFRMIGQNIYFIALGHSGFFDHRFLIIWGGAALFNVDAISAEEAHIKDEFRDDFSSHRPDKGIGSEFEFASDYESFIILGLQFSSDGDGIGDYFDSAGG